MDKHQESKRHQNIGMDVQDESSVKESKQHQRVAKSSSSIKMELKTHKLKGEDEDRTENKLQKFPNETGTIHEHRIEVTDKGR